MLSLHNRGKSWAKSSLPRVQVNYQVSYYQDAAVISAKEDRTGIKKYSFYEVTDYGFEPIIINWLVLQHFNGWWFSSSRIDVVQDK